MTQPLGDGEALFVGHVVKHELIDAHAIIEVLSAGQREEYFLLWILWEPVVGLVRFIAIVVEDTLNETLCEYLWESFE